MRSAAHWIDTLGLGPHPEGGYYRETYRSGDHLRAADLAARFGSSHCMATAIVYLLEQGDFSAFHRIRSDEVWHHYDGGDLRLHVLGANGDYREYLVGTGSSDALPQAMVPAGHWFAVEPVDGTPYALAGCTVSPGFEFADFEMADCSALCRRYPARADLIRRLTRGDGLRGVPEADDGAG